MNYSCCEATANEVKEPFLFFKNDALNTSFFIFRGLNYSSTDNLKETEKIDTLINFNYKLKKPITIYMKMNKYEYFGEIPDLELYSYGSTKFEVLREINEELTDLFEKIVNIDDKMLGKYPKKWKNILLEYITK